MIRNLKALGLALVAVFAISAMAASAAQAEAPAHLTAFNTPGEEDEAAHLKAEQTSGSLRDKLTVNGIAVRCSTSTATANLATGNATEVTVFPTYEGCLTAGLFKTHVELNGCHYRLYNLTYTENEPDVFDVTADIVCPQDEEITITTTNLEQTASLCTTHIPPQTGLEYGTVENQTGNEPTDIELVGHFTGITAQVTDVNNCPIAPDHYTNATFEGTTTVRAYNELEEQIDLEATPTLG